MPTSKEIFDSNIQEILISTDGEIISSNQVIFDVLPGENLFYVHPFFESLKDLFITAQKQFYVFPCVNFIIKETNYYCDITIKKENGFFAFILFNYSERYHKLQKIESKKNKERLKNHLEKINITSRF